MANSRKRFTKGPTDRMNDDKLTSFRKIQKEPRIVPSFGPNNFSGWKPCLLLLCCLLNFGKTNTNFQMTNTQLQQDFFKIFDSLYILYFEQLYYKALPHLCIEMSIKLTFCGKTSQAENEKEEINERYFQELPF